MKNLFEHTSAPWIRYSSYEYIIKEIFFIKCHRQVVLFPVCKYAAVKFPYPAVPLEWGADELYLSNKPSYDMILRRLMLAGDFLDFIFDRPETIHELVTDTDLSTPDRKGAGFTMEHIPV